MKYSRWFVYLSILNSMNDKPSDFQSYNYKAIYHEMYYKPKDY